MASLDNGGNAGALISVSNTWYRRPTVERALRSTWNLRDRRPLIGGAERQISQAKPFRHGGTGVFDLWLRSRRSHSGARSDRLVQSWLLGLVPAGVSPRVILTFDSWHNARTSTEISRDALGTVTIANLATVRAALKIIDAGNSVVVQVCSIPDPSEETLPRIRVWVCNRNEAKAIDAATLEQNRRGLLPVQAPRAAARFETGWIVTGEPGGAHRTRGRAR